MLDPVTTPLLFLVLGKIGEEVIGDACKDFLKDKLKSLFEWVGGHGRKSDLELAYDAALQEAFATCLEMLLQNLAASGYIREELKQYEASLKTFVKDPTVANELLEAIKNPLDKTRPSADMLAQRWKDLKCDELPDDLWGPVTNAFRRRATKQAFVNESLREVLNAQNLDQIRDLLDRDGGVRPDVREDKYIARMRTKYAPVDLANLMPAHADNPGQLVIRDVFVPQQVKENPPPIELPKDFEKLLRDAESTGDLADDTRRALIAEELRIATTAYVTQAPKAVLDVVTSERLIVLIGEPGSGKSTLLRYLLLGVLQPLRDPAGHLLPWAKAFADRKSFALIIELRDFIATRQKNDEVDSFVDFVRYLGRTEQYFLDDRWLDDTLQNRPSLILFDGLDEIFDRTQREKVIQEIVGFSQRYTNARIVVSSRPVGYRDQVLRQAGFKHFAIQDLNDSQIEAFTRGWFRLTFPQQPDLADQRVVRVMASIGRSPSIRLLAGNPMLLTIMVLLAREQELPRERVAFYESAVNVLCHNWDANRNLGLPETDYMRLDDKKELLRRIALRMQTGAGGLAGNAIHETDLESEAAKWFEERFKQTGFEAIRSARRMIEQLHERNYVLCLRGPRLYGFVHRTFLEYLTATEYVSQFRDRRTLTIEGLATLFADHAGDEDWREVLRLIAGQIDEQFVAEIIGHLLPKAPTTTPGRSPAFVALAFNPGIEVPRPVWERLCLAIWCVGEGRTSSRLEDSGRVLTAYVLLAGHANRWRKDVWQNVLLQAIDDIGPRWPGQAYLKAQVTAALPTVGLFTFNSLLYPRTLGAIANDRAELLPLLSYKSGIFTSAIRRTVTQVLVKRWPDGETRDLLLKQAVAGELSDMRSSALTGLAGQWRDSDTLALLRERAVTDSDDGPRSTAITLLSEHWPDPSTKALVVARATDDAESGPRETALRQLANTWPDASTREFLESRAVHDDSENARRLAISILFGSWKESALPLVRSRVTADPSESVRGAAAVILGGVHSPLGKVLYTKEADGNFPHLDPLLPLSEEHIVKALEKAETPEAERESAVASLNAFLGWDISVGAGAPA